MAHKDYVSRGRASKAPPPPPKPKVPWIRLFLTIMLVAGFAYLLWAIKDKAEEVQPAAASNDSTEQDEEVALPILGEEEWEFIKTLPQTTVEVEVAEQEKSDKRYLMQCGSFKQQAQAEEMKATIAFAGLVAQVGPISGENGLWYRVYLGPYELKRAAEKDRHTLRRSNINTCKIWYWNL